MKQNRSVSTIRAETYDVVVVGGGAGGVAAAIGSARQGARTLLIERYGFLGGAATTSNVLAYCGFFAQGPTAVPAIGGIGAELLQQLRGCGANAEVLRSKTGNWIIPIDPEAVKVALDELAMSAGVELRLHSFLVGAQRDGCHVNSIAVADHMRMHDIEARAFVDASGEADLSFRAGLSSSVGVGKQHRLQAASFPLRIGGVPADVALALDRRQALAKVINECLTGARVREDGGVFMRLGGSSEIWWMTIDLETDGLSSESLTDAEVASRRLAWRALRLLRHQPGFENAYLVSTGPQIGVRESRRPASRAIVTREDALRGRRSDSAVARAAWPMEIHESPGKPVTYIPLGGKGFFDVPYEALVAHGVENLWLAGRVIGADSFAFGSIRVMGTAFGTGHAAGVSAALHAAGRVSPAAVRAALRAQNAII